MLFKKKLTQSKNGAVLFDFKMKLPSSSVKRSVFLAIFLYLAAVDYRDREYNDSEELLCTMFKNISTKQHILTV